MAHSGGQSAAHLDRIPCGAPPPPRRRTPRETDTLDRPRDTLQLIYPLETPTRGTAERHEGTPRGARHRSRFRHHSLKTVDICLCRYASEACCAVVVVGVVSPSPVWNIPKLRKIFRSGVQGAEGSSPPPHDPMPKVFAPHIAGTFAPFSEVCFFSPVPPDLGPTCRTTLIDLCRNGSWCLT